MCCSLKKLFTENITCTDMNRFSNNGESNGGIKKIDPLNTGNTTNIFESSFKKNKIYWYWSTDTVIVGNCILS